MSELTAFKMRWGFYGSSDHVKTTVYAHSYKEACTLLYQRINNPLIWVGGDV